MNEITHLNEYKAKRRLRAAQDMAERIKVDNTLALCMHCGAEYLWGERQDHRCGGDSRSKHPSNRH